MIKYIKIANYTIGDSINKQIQDIVDAGMMDKDTRLFFSKNTCVTMRDIKPLVIYFDIVYNNDIDNVIFTPNDYFIYKFVENGENFEDKR